MAATVVRITFSGIGIEVGKEREIDGMHCATMKKSLAAGVRARVLARGGIDD